MHNACMCTRVVHLSGMLQIPTDMHFFVACITMLEVFTNRVLVCSRSLSIHSQCPKSDSSWALNSDVVKRVSRNFPKLPLEVYSKIAVRIKCTAVYKNLKLVLNYCCWLHTPTFMDLSHAQMAVLDIELVLQHCVDSKL